MSSSFWEFGSQVRSSHRRAFPYAPNQNDWLPVRTGYVARRSTATLSESCHLCPRDVARLCGVQFPGIRIVSSIKPSVGISLRPKSKRLVTCSVGLRRLEIDGHFESPTLCRPFSGNSDRKFDQAIGGHFLTIQIKTIGCLFGRATSLGDRRLLCSGNGTRSECGNIRILHSLALCED